MFTCSCWHYKNQIEREKMRSQNIDLSNVYNNTDKPIDYIWNKKHSEIAYLRHI